MFEWFKSLTGSWGPALLDWYLANSWINLLIIAYGVLVMLAWRNFDLIEERVYQDLLDHTEIKKGEPKFPSHPSISWEEAVHDLSFPLIARRGRLLLRRLSAAQAAEMVDMRALRLRADLRFKNQKEQQNQK